MTAELIATRLNRKVEWKMPARIRFAGDEESCELLSHIEYHGTDGYRPVLDPANVFTVADVLSVEGREIILKA